MGRRVPLARALRAAQTEPERLPWGALRDRRLNGFKFVRQEPVGPYVADFLCRERRLIVEADGSQHAQSARDARRDAYLAAQGYEVLRFWNREVMTELEGVRDTILARLEARPERPATWARPREPSPLAGERGEAPFTGGRASEGQGPERG